VTDFEGLIHRLREGNVRFVLVGGFAGTVLGSPRITVDLDIVYARDADNLASLARTLEPLSPYAQLIQHSTRIRVFDTDIDVVTLPQLIRLKRAAGRPKDLEALAQLEALLEEQRGEA
jgi:predicted nucleotidyltransferase